MDSDQIKEAFLKEDITATYKLGGRVLKQGIKTTEFWVTIGTIAATTTASLAQVLDPKYAAIATAISALAYNVSRGFAKNNNQP